VAAQSLFFTPLYSAGIGTVFVTGGFISGNDLISGAVNVGAAGSLYPGATVGTLSIDGTLDISAMADGGTGKLAFGLGPLAGTNDQIAAASTLTIGSGKLGFSDFTFTNPTGVEPGTYTLITSSGLNPGDSLDESNLSGTINGYYGTIRISGNNIILAVNTLISSSIVDDKSGAAVIVNTLVSYTVSFIKDMDHTTVTSADFSNAGTASVTIGSVSETSPTSGAFSVQATPTSAGTLILKVNNDAVLTDVDGKNVETSSPIADDTTIIVRTIYQAWAYGYLPDDVSNPSDNLDGDSLTNLLEFAFGTDPTTSTSGTISYIDLADGEVTAGLQEARNLAVGSGVDFRAVFGRRKDYVAAGLTYTVQFSAGLDIWVSSNATPTRLSGISSNGSIDAVSVPYPFFISTARGVEKPTFFRIAVSLTP
jgi:hypothetical protein